MSLLAGAGPVSYTHLDVYKRQAGERLALVAAFIAVLVTLRHEANIRRLVRGEEPRIAPGRKPQGPTS